MLQIFQSADHACLEKFEFADDDLAHVDFSEHAVAAERIEVGDGLQDEAVLLCSAADGSSEWVFTLKF